MYIYIYSVAFMFMSVLHASTNVRSIFGLRTQHERSEFTRATGVPRGAGMQFDTLER